ncbi:uncharacterized protein LOC142333134 [Lycorma delicatula]|uniref:uncharacterized protein LOC142333134 n=1 Tax=Lycorma delicatula TaxID=130591 RepID=UPI003F516A7A
MASTATVNCPLCCQSTFSSVPSLCLSLISVTTRLLECPVCHDTVFGLDKFTIHLFSHILNLQQQQQILLNNESFKGNNDNSNMSSSSSNLNENNDIQGQFNVNVSTDNQLHSSTMINLDTLIDKNNQNVLATSLKNKVEPVSNKNVNSCDEILPNENYNVLKLNKNCCNINDKLLPVLSDINCVIITDQNIDNRSSNNNNCDMIKKSLEPFLKYNDNKAKSLPQGYNIPDSSSKSVISNTGTTDDGDDIDNFDKRKMCHLNDKSQKKLSANHNKICCFNPPNKLLLRNSSDKCCSYSENNSSLSDNSGITNFIKLNVNSDKLNKNEIVNNNKINATDLLYRSVFLRNGLNSNNSDSLVKGTVFHNSNSDSIVNNNDLCKDSSIKLSSNKFTKETASQAIQTVEESFTKINSSSLKLDSRIKFISGDNGNKNMFPTINKKKEICNSLQQNKNLSPSMSLLNATLTLSDNNSSNGNGNSNDNVMCDVCLFSFPDPTILNMHKQLVHSDDGFLNDKKKSFACHLCSKSFKMRGSLMVHRRVAHPTIAVLKKLEAAAASSATNIVIPEIPDTLSPGGDMFYPCNMCGKNFKKEQHLIQHEKTHEVKQWECDVCSKAFSTKYFLKKHRRLHTGEMPYSCSTCGKNFTFQQSYHKHLLYHSDEKPYVCCDCGRAFKELSTLHNHQRIHTGEKPFSCETCGKCFRQRVSYLVHRRIHTGAMPYKCNVCNRNFRYKVSERTHKCTILPSSSSSTTSTITSVVSSSGSNMIKGCINELVITEADKTSTCNVSLSSIQNNNQNQKYDLNAAANNNNNNTSSVIIDNVNWTNDQMKETKDDNSELNIINEIDNNKKEINKKITQLSSDLSPMTTVPVVTNTDLFETTDFFSLILSPSTSSPTEHMQQLSLSPNSSQNNWEVPCSSSTFSNATSTNNNNLQNNNNLLQTVDENSFKEFLYHVSDYH